MTQAKNITPEKKKEVAKNLKWQRDKDREMVKGIFRYHEVPGGGFEFVFKQYKEDDVEKFTMIDGQAYTIPLGVAKHLNNNVWYPQYDYVNTEGMFSAQSVGGSRVAKITKKVRRVSFQSLEFLDIEGVPTNAPGIVTVEAASII